MDIGLIILLSYFGIGVALGIGASCYIYITQKYTEDDPFIFIILVQIFSTVWPLVIRVEWEEY